MSKMGRLATYGLIVIVVAGLLLRFCLADTGGVERDKGVKRTLRVIGYDERDDGLGTIKVHPGDMVQIETKTWPVVPGFLDSKPDWENLVPDKTNMWSLEYIGKAGTPAAPMKRELKLGGSSWSVFFYVVETGEAKIRVFLADKDGKEIEGYSAKYTILSSRPKE